MSVIHIHLHDLDLTKLFNWLDQRGGQWSHIEAMLTRLTQMQEQEMAILDDLKEDMDAETAAIAQNTDVVESAKQAITKLVEQVASMGASATDLQTLKQTIQGWANQTRANSDALGQAVANVPTTP